MNTNGQLCRCNNCGSLFNDTNSQTDAPRFNNTESLPALRTCDDVVNSIKDFFQGCPECKTDGYLSDVTSVTDLTAAERKIYKLAA